MDVSPEPVGKAAHNERRKLFANTVNAVGIGVLAIAGVTPVVTQPYSSLLMLKFLTSAAIFAVTHLVALAVLSRLED